jgi:hypothetical protein
MPAASSRAGKGVEEAEIRHHRPRLVEGPHQVLARRQIHPGLAPTEASTIASRVVGTSAKEIPRR